MNETITGDSPMQAVLQVFPGAQRALFRKYHIGGCSSCGFQPEETLARVCERNGIFPSPTCWSRSARATRRMPVF
ncbi:MAG: hypothetical protein CM1200mP29_00290 [Verrucomicrobiota bacterium]|nr:MAG: hypothetical protein CM1200mP29_00290 [Verrucomicrobiota bacterium]